MKTWNCGYCFSEYQSPEIDHWTGGYNEETRSWDVKGPKRYTCSDACKKRLTIWKNWVRVTQQQAILGDVNKPTRTSPLTSTGIADAVSRFNVTDNQLVLV